MNSFIERRFIEILDVLEQINIRLDKIDKTVEKIKQNNDSLEKKIVKLEKDYEELLALVLKD